MNKEQSSPCNRSTQLSQYAAVVACPTPIGPKETLEVVDAVPFNFFISSLDTSIVDLLHETFSAKQSFSTNPDKCYSFSNEYANEESSTQRRSNVMFDAFEGHAADISAHPKASATKLSDACTARKGHWLEKYDELVAFQRDFGHCLVPNNWANNVKLAQWVKRQRHQYKCRMEGKHSNLTDERLHALEKLGFVWSVQEDTWEERFNELCHYKELHSHCNVPKNCADHPQLAVWVKYQRRHLKLYMGGKRSSMTRSRFLRLTRIGFQWNPRQKKVEE